MPLADPPRLEGWLTVAEVAERLGLTKQAVHKMLRAGDFKSLRRVGGPTKPVYLVSEADLRGVASRRAKAAADREADRLDAATG